MKALFTLLVLQFFLLNFQIYSDKNPSAENSNSLVFIRQQIVLEANNIRSYIWNSGVLDQNQNLNNTAGFEWPKNSGKTAIFTTGLTLGAYVNNQLRLSTASYKGEYVPGRCENSIFYTDSTFKLYRVTRGDNQFSNPDWANWGLMVPYGAPFKDVNNNGTYEPVIDLPGINGAAQTIFVCLTDADTNAHTIGEGFSGGTIPLYNEVHFTVWCYDNPGYNDMQFMKWVVINKNTIAWDSTIAAIMSDTDLGNYDDDYIGCDTTRNLGFCYNADNDDPQYGINPPAVGIMFLNCGGANSVLSSFSTFTNVSTSTTVCEYDPVAPQNAYWYLKGYKSDGTPWINIHTMQPTKFVFAYPGWVEGEGRIANCGGQVGGPVIPSSPGDRRFVMNYKPANQRLTPGDSFVIMSSQLIARGNSNLNSLTQLLQAADVAKNLCQNNFVIGINQVSNEIPVKFNLYQNYPNPFNPVTKIKFDLPGNDFVTLKIYDVLGREIELLINEKLNPGTYSVDWDASNYPSGVYFYRLNTERFTQTKKMLLVK